MDAPDLEIPEAGEYLWDWYFDASSGVQRVKDGVCNPVPPSEFGWWMKLTNTFVYPTEYAILRSMDAAFCDEMNKELSDYRLRQSEKQNASAARSKSSKSRK